MRTGILTAIRKLEADTKVKQYNFPIQPPALYPGVLPKGTEKAPIAMDASPYDFARAAYSTVDGSMGFPGYSYLAMLATRAEFRAFAAALSTEITREWLKLTSSDTAGEGVSAKITKLEQEFKRLNVQQVIQRAAENDSYFGRGQIFLEIDGAKRDTPLILSEKTIALGSLKRIKSIEPMWTTPNAYNALDPAAPDFYKPTTWFMLGQEVHASRLLTIVTRELPDMLKPAYNFSGMSLSQLAEPYVDNWLRTRQSVSDLIANFSITAMKTSMDQVLQGGDDAGDAAADLVNRAKLFTLMRNNQGLMLLDKDREELVQLNVPLSGLHELQAQAQEQMCAVSRLPAVILTGISPSGFGNLAEGEMQAHYDNTSAQQEAYWRDPIDIILKVAQLSLFGSIDPNIGFEFNPLYQMTQKELAEIRKSNADTATAYINGAVIDPSEERERLARDPESGYQGLDTSLDFTKEEGEGNEDEEL